MSTLVLVLGAALTSPAQDSKQPNSGSGSNNIASAPSRSENLINPQPQYPVPGENLKAGAKHFLTDMEFWLSLEVLVFGGIVVFVEFLLLKGKGVTAEEALRVYAITVIIIGALFTVTAGFDNVSVAPAFGLLGTVAGYILGRRGSPASEAAEPSREEQ